MKNYNMGRLGFTLIELLVVVLIIGILAAVALPQYQKAVEKSKAIKMLPLLKSVAQAAEVYYLANNSFPASLDELDVSLPADFTGNTKFFNGVSDTLSNEQWSLQLQHEGATGWNNVILGEISGPYTGAGFGYILQIADRDSDTFSRTMEHSLVCMETISSGKIYQQAAGTFCEKLMQGKFLGQGAHRLYALSD